jgi:uncharacterized protein (DUF1330 family)
MAMKKWTTLALTALAGAAIGALAVERIHAQTTKSPAAYYVVELDVTNEDIFSKQWSPKADETVRAAGGVYLVRSANVERIEGAAPKRLLITKWENLDKLAAWRESDAYMKTLPLLDKVVRSVRSYAVEGVN